MRETTFIFDGETVPLYSVNTVVVGSGAAALSAAVALHEYGQPDVVIVTEARGGGASANAGSDKQTYYKLSLAGDALDSPRQMAEDLFAGGSMHGDIALCEAQQSAQAFFRLVQYGVPFPHDAFGGFVGYRTDHSVRPRATSAGPLTSRLMVQALDQQVRARGIPVLDHHQVVRLLVDRSGADPAIVGAIALTTDETGEPRVVAFDARNVVLATGGPGGLYADSVYPAEQTGSIGVALEAGAVAQNLTESQFGLASIAVRWNVSGSYQQCLPRYVSTNEDGGDEREFVDERFPDLETLTGAAFRKGYEWPFDVRRVANYGSSLIDLLVHRERVQLGRRVYLDFTRNPGARFGTFSLDVLAADAREYLRKCGANGSTPIERLRQMNEPAVEFYRQKGIDLRRERLEIAVCAQHNNGGLKANAWWESNVRGLFPVGEVNGSHGVYRPGGAALNAGQVGAMRAALFIARRRDGTPVQGEMFCGLAKEALRDAAAYARRAQANQDNDRRSVGELRAELQARMSRHAALVRDPEGVRRALSEAWRLCEDVGSRAWAADASQVPALFRCRDLALAHAVYLEALAEYLGRGGQSRGSSIVVDESADSDADFAFRSNEPGAFVDSHILEIGVDDKRQVHKEWVRVRPIPRTDGWFESVWKAYRNDEVVR